MAACHGLHLPTCTVKAVRLHASHPAPVSSILTPAASGIDTPSAGDQGTAIFLLQLVLWTLVYLIARQLLSFRRSVFLSKAVRTLLADFGPILAIIAATGAPLNASPLPYGGAHDGRHQRPGVIVDHLKAPVTIHQRGGDSPTPTAPLPATLLPLAVPTLLPTSLRPQNTYTAYKSSLQVAHTFPKASLMCPSKRCPCQRAHRGSPASAATGS